MEVAVRLTMLLRAVVATSLLVACSTQTVTMTETTQTSEPAEPQPGATMDDPIRRGQPARLDDWEVSVVGFTPNANEFVLTSRWNDPPRPGYQFVLVKVKSRT
jgi:hypothetical protein